MKCNDLTVFMGLIVVVALFILLMVNSIVKICIIVQFILSIDFFDLGRELDAVSWLYHVSNRVIVRFYLALGGVEWCQDY